LNIQNLTHFHPFNSRNENFVAGRYNESHPQARTLYHSVI